MNPRIILHACCALQAFQICSRVFHWFRRRLVRAQSQVDRPGRGLVPQESQPFLGPWAATDSPPHRRPREYFGGAFDCARAADGAAALVRRMEPAGADPSLDGFPGLFGSTKSRSTTSDAHEVAASPRARHKPAGLLRTIRTGRLWLDVGDIDASLSSRIPVQIPFRRTAACTDPRTAPDSPLERGHLLADAVGLISDGPRSVIERWGCWTLWGYKWQPRVNPLYPHRSDLSGLFQFTNMAPALQDGQSLPRASGGPIGRGTARKADGTGDV
ncbi:hypothetical protein DFJ74DRAFT_684891 [Hyaloraphidium curvatum]|nr:hypothetical protein DFJ74DRAFT_684891 [Hyaloraphidium curvatum]